METDSNTSLLTIIIPVYNGEAYIAPLMEAFRRQTDQRFRLIFVDDGSQDRTYALLSELPGKDPFSVLVYRQENQGVSVARNKGIELAKTPYITFLDVDDSISEDYISVIYDNLEAFSPDVFVFQTKRVREGDFCAVEKNPAGRGRPVSAYDMLTNMISNPTRYGVVNTVIDRAFLLETGIRFSVGYRYYEDYDFLYRLFAVGRHMVMTERVLYFYVLQEGSAMSRFTEDRFRCLSLMEDLRVWIYRNCPAFLPRYDRWGIARIYWSLMWQAALAMPEVREARRLGKISGALSYMRRLRDYPDRKVRISSRLYCLCPSLFFRLARRLGAARTKVKPVPPETFRTYFAHQKKRVLVYGMTQGIGGIESYIMNVFRHLDQDRLTFDFVTDFPTMAYEEEVIERGSYVYKIPAKGKHPVKQLRAFNRLLREHPEYETVYFNILDAGAAFTMLPPFRYRRTIVAHSHNGSTQKAGLHRKTQGLLRFLTDRQMACSEVAARYMFGDKAVDAGEVTVVNNAIDLTAFRYDPAARTAARKALGLSETQTVILHIGRMTSQKNPYFLLDIAEALAKADPEAILLYVGWGEMEDAVKAYAGQKGLDGKPVCFLGASREVPALMQAADVFLMPSLFEGLPVAGIEAQAADLACVFSDTITREIQVTDRVFFVSLETSPEEWARIVLEAAKEREKRGDTFDRLSAAGYNIQQEKDRVTEALCKTRGGQNADR